MYVCMNDMIGTISLPIRARIFRMNESNTDFILAPKINYSFCFYICKEKKILKENGQDEMALHHSMLHGATRALRGRHIVAPPTDPRLAGLVRVWLLLDPRLVGQG